MKNLINHVVSSNNSDLYIDDCQGYICSSEAVNQFLNEEQIISYFKGKGWTAVDFNPTNSKGLDAYYALVTAVAPVRLGDNDFIRCAHRLDHSNGSYPTNDKKQPKVHAFLSSDYTIGNSSVSVPSIATDGATISFITNNGDVEDMLISKVKGLGRAFNVSLTVTDGTVSGLVNDSAQQYVVNELRAKTFKAISQACKVAGINTSKQFDVLVVGLATNINVDHREAKFNEEGKLVSGYIIPNVTAQVPIFKLFVKSCNVKDVRGHVKSELVRILGNDKASEKDYLRRVNNAKDSVEQSQTTELMNQEMGKYIPNLEALGTQQGFTVSVTNNTIKEFTDLIGQPKPAQGHNTAIGYSVMTKFADKYGYTFEQVVALFNNCFTKGKVQELINAKNTFLANPSKIDTGVLTNAHKAVLNYESDVMLDIVKYASANGRYLNQAILDYEAQKSASKFEPTISQSNVANNEVPTSNLSDSDDDYYYEYEEETTFSTTAVIGGLGGIATITPPVAPPVNNGFAQSTVVDTPPVQEQKVEEVEEDFDMSNFYEEEVEEEVKKVGGWGNDSTEEFDPIDDFLD